jgi:NAD(P)-dependent dehydrogenase (short-subunit alcohol dehydrogenase family)
MTRPNHLQDQKALVTGATAGLGKAIALRLARDGAEVIVVGRNAVRGAETVDEINGAGGRARFIAADLNDLADIQRLAQDAGDIDVLVNNAGRSVWAPTEHLGVDDFDSMFASNVRAPFYLVAAFAPAMAARGSGSIVNISSMAGRIGLVNGAAYGATKAALASLTQGWTAEYSPGASESTRSPPARSTPDPRPASCSTPSGPPPPSTAQPIRPRSPRSSRSSPRRRRATSPAPSSPPTGAAQQSSAKLQARESKEFGHGSNPGNANRGGHPTFPP